jgi:hypothetical protein
MKCTLKVNMILEHGEYHARGSVLDRELIPPHLRTPEYVVDGVAKIDTTTPIDEIDIKDVELEDEQESPMQELTLPAMFEDEEEKPVRKPLLKRLKPKKLA